MLRLVAFSVGLVCFVILPASPAADKEKVNAAIKKGMEYLKKNVGNAGGGGGDHMGTGPTVLAGLAMLESGTTKDDPVMAAITRIVRETSYGETKTYNVVLNILYLDRLNEPGDIPLIQLLGARLVIGQTNLGGWGYNCGPEVPAAEQQRLRTALRPNGTTGLHPEASNLLKVGRVGGTGDDNSNTQFAVIGAWVAQRRGVPCSQTIQLIDLRFQRSQSPTDYGWSYSPGMGATSTPAMTCAGLLGLAVGKAHEEARKSGKKLVGEGNPEAKKKPKDKENQDDPFYNPPARGEKAKIEDEEDVPEEDEEQKEQAKKLMTIRDMAIERALQALGRVLKDGGNLGGNGNWGGVNDLYFIWSLERVGVAYGLSTIGDVDWYEWGVKLLLPAQQADGSWSGSHSALVETSFAILFLGKANFVSDLTRQIDGKVKDPGNGELRGSRSGPAAIAAMGRKIEMNKDIPDPKNPTLNKVRGPSQADLIAEGLLARQSEAKWDGKLKTARESKGGQHTAGLAQAIPFLSEKRQILAREALSDRAARMTKETLAKMLKDRDVEIRRAACLAVALRDEKSLTFDLIERVMDIDDSVVRAARASLKTMHNKDFGPNTGANDDRKRAAFDEWNSWYTSGAK